MSECGNKTREQKIEEIMERITPNNVDFVLALLDHPMGEWEQMCMERMRDFA